MVWWYLCACVFGFEDKASLQEGSERTTGSVRRREAMFLEMSQMSGAVQGPATGLCRTDREDRMVARGRKRT